MKISTAVCLVLGLSVAASCAFAQQRGPNAIDGAQPGAFDYYRLTLSWSPEFCYSHRDDPECTSARHYGFLVHGLWPESNNGTYPENCSSQAGLPNASDMVDIMPDASLVAHEWSTHGTCSGLGARAYFDLVRQAFTSIAIPQQFVAPTHSFAISPSALKKAFEQPNPKLTNDNIVITCRHGYLTAVEICLTKNLTPRACPAGQDCRAGTILVPPVR